MLQADAVLAANQSLSADVWDALPAAGDALPVAGDAWPAACHALPADWDAHLVARYAHSAGLLPTWGFVDPQKANAQYAAHSDHSGHAEFAVSQRTPDAGLEQVVDEDADDFHSACQVQHAPDLELAVVVDQQLSGLMLHAVPDHHAEHHHSLHTNSKQINSRSLEGCQVSGRSDCRGHDNQ